MKNALFVNFAYLTSIWFVQVQQDPSKQCKTAVTWWQMYSFGQVSVTLSYHICEFLFLDNKFDSSWPILLLHTKASIHFRMQRVSDSLAFPPFNCLSSVSCELVHFESCPKPQSMPIKCLQLRYDSCWEIDIKINKSVSTVLLVALCGNGRV